MFRYAKHVKIYDRYVGRSIVQPKNAPKYKSMLKRLLNVFVKNSRQGIFEVYCGFKKEGNTKVKVEEAKSKLKELRKELKKIYPKSKLIIKDEKKEEECQHDRYIITEQLAISMGRGIGLLSEELLSPEDVLLDFNIAFCSDPGEMERDFKKLPDLSLDM